MNNDELAQDANEETLDSETTENVEADETEAETETEAEVEVVDTSVTEETEEGEPARQKPRRKDRRQVRRLLNKTDKLTNELQQSNSQIQNLQNQINQMQGVQQPPQASPQVGEKMPLLTDFYNDEAQHATAMQAWYQRQIDTTVNTRMTQFSQETNAQQQQVLSQQKQQDHYQAADSLQVSDYEEAEETAIKLLGNPLANEIVNRAENSATVLYHFGKNPQVAIDFANLAKHDAVGAAVKLGQLSGSLKVRPKMNGGRANPETKIEGSAATKAPNAGAFQKQFDLAVNDANKTGNIAAMQKVRKEAKAAGVNLT